MYKLRLVPKRRSRYKYYKGKQCNITNISREIEAILVELPFNFSSKNVLRFSIGISIENNLNASMY